MSNIKYLGTFQIPNDQKKLDLFECSCGYKTGLESGRFLSYDVYCNHCEETSSYHLKNDENKDIKDDDSELEKAKVLIKELKDSLSLNEIADVLETYLERHPQQKEISILSSSNNLKMGLMPNEIRNFTKVGIDYRNSLIKMCIESFNKDKN